MKNLMKSQGITKADLEGNMAIRSIVFVLGVNLMVSIEERLIISVGFIILEP